VVLWSTDVVSKGFGADGFVADLVCRVRHLRLTRLYSWGL
jgi:hypothetical protein